MSHHRPQYGQQYGQHGQQQHHGQAAYHHHQQQHQRGQQQYHGQAAYQQQNQQQYQQQQHQQQQRGGPQFSSTPQPPQGVDPTLWAWFQSVDQNNSGSINCEELQQALLNNNWSQFNAETCRLMIAMFDQDKSGTINIHEFSALWKYVQDWKGCFDGFDNDRSGTIDAEELNKAFTTFGYRLSVPFCELCVRVFDTTSAHTMKFDSFIQCCIMLKTFTDQFMRFDKNQNGVIDINYEQFMDMAVANAL